LPELPEVEVVRRGLETHVVGRAVSAVQVLHPRPVRRHLAGPDDFAAVLTGRTFVGARRRGKYWWLPLDNGDALLGHLGMSGQLLVHTPGAPPDRHLRVRLSLTGTPERELWYADQRMFGGLSVSPGGAELPGEIAHIARDPMDPLFDDELFVRRVRRSSRAVKRILLDQSIISGVGNIYADEGLWRAGVHGERPGDRLSRAQVTAVIAGCRAVMASALEQGGTSFDSLYVNVNGQSGYFDRSLEVYGRAGEPCSRCASPVARVAFMNRSSYFCPRCQARPRRRSA